MLWRHARRFKGRISQDPADLMRSKNELIQAQIAQLGAKTQKIKAELAERHGLSVDDLEEMETELAEKQRGSSNPKRSLSKRRVPIPLAGSRKP